MKLIIAGSRDIPIDTAIRLIDEEIVDSGFNGWMWRDEVTEVVVGGARGVDRAAEIWAEQFHIPVKRFLPDYQRYGSKFAPIKRNVEMGGYGDRLLAIWNRISPGTLNMMEVMRSLHKLICLRALDVGGTFSRYVMSNLSMQAEMEFPVA